MRTSVGVVRGLGRVGQDRDAPGGDDGVDRVARSHPLSRHERRPAPREPAREGVAHVARTARQDERLRDMGSSAGRVRDRASMRRTRRPPGHPAARRASSVRSMRARRPSRWRASAASSDASSGSMPKPRTCSSPAARPRPSMGRPCSSPPTVLISSPGIRRGPDVPSPSPAARSSRYPWSVSWSVSDATRRPQRAHRLPQREGLERTVRATAVAVQVHPVARERGHAGRPTGSVTRR